MPPPPPPKKKKKKKRQSGDVSSGCVAICDRRRGADRVRRYSNFCGMTANSFRTVNPTPPTVLVSVMPGPGASGDFNKRPLIA